MLVFFQKELYTIESRRLVMIKDIEEEIQKHIHQEDYKKGSAYAEESIEYIGKNSIETHIKHQFLVESQSSYKKYMVQIDILDNKIDSLYCTCPRFRETKSCKHLAACLICYSNKIFDFHEKESKEKASSILLAKLKNKFSQKNRRKEEIKLIPYIGFHIKRRYHYTSLKVKIGKDKTYSLLGKLGSFLTCYEKGEDFRFGSGFVYQPALHYFSEKSLQFLDFLKELKENYAIDGNYANLSDKNIKKLFQFCKLEIDDEDEKKRYHIRESFPFQLHFSKKENKYYLSFEGKLEEIDIITDDCEYVRKNQEIFHLNKEEQFLLSECMHLDLSEIVFPEEMFADYQKHLIGIVKEQLLFDDSTNDIIIDLKPEVEIYFDLKEDHILATPKFVYKNKTISYFDEVDGIIRDEEFENNVIQRLYQYQFHKMSNFFLLDDFDCVCDFLSGALDELAKDYKVFTSEKMKSQNILKDNHIQATFSIGKDHILSYQFDLGNIAQDELQKVLKSLDQKKKYYRLKSGDILSLENDNLKEFNQLSKEFEFDSKKISNLSGEIPKYRALYLDSIKNKDYHIIHTDSSFNEFIQQFQNYKESHVSFTKQQEKILRDYQKEGIEWLYTITKCGFGGILADEMGLGKSLQTIYFIKELLKEGNGKKFLIVCPTALVYNWENEFEKFASNLKYQVFSGAKITRREQLQSFKGNIYITSYGLLREDLDLYEKNHFECMIIDEAQNIKNPLAGITKSTKSIDATTKIALTGTPIENSIIELWSIFDFIMPGFLSSQMKFQKKYQVKEFDEQTNQMLSNLKEQVRPFILRRLKSEVIKDLPEKIENKIFIDLKEEQKKIYAAEVVQAQKQMNEMIEQSGFTKNKMMILSLLTRLRQICIDPSLILDHYTGGSAKIESLLDIIKEVSSSGHKILLFTSFKTALDKIKEKLDEEGISNYTIAGDVPSKKRQMLVDAFNKDQTKIFLIMLKSGGTGLNLTSADTVIHLDLWWNPQAESQATDRTHRIGQKKNVSVIKLICKGTIEEKILELQEKKKILSDKILSGNLEDSSYLSSLSEQDIKMLLSSENKN